MDASSGSLGQGLSTAVGIALAGKMDEKFYQVYVLLGDGECQEGQVWEAAMAGAHYKLDNLTAIIDRNDLQSTGKVEKVMSLGNLKDKWKSFGWNVLEVEGHNFTSLLSTFRNAARIKNQPKVVIAKTIKGYGVPFIEGNLDYHVRSLNEDELKRALELIG